MYLKSITLKLIVLNKSKSGFLQMDPKEKNDNSFQNFSKAMLYIQQNILLIKVIYVKIRKKKVIFNRAEVVFNMNIQ